MTLLNDEYKQLYAGYYGQDSALKHKRNLSADATVEHIVAVAGHKKWGRIIDVGAGNGSVLAKLDRMADELYAVEISESGVSEIQALGLANLKEARVFDGYTIPYPDKFFDLAICIHVLEHVEHERLFLREMARVAKEIIVEIPLEGGLQITKSIRQSERFGHLNFYNVPGFLYLLKTAGLEPINYGVMTSSGDYERHLYGEVRGTIKNTLRKTLVRFAPRFAPWLLAYLLTVHCKSRDAK